MLIKPNNYDEVEVNEFDYVPLELGGHKGIILDVEEYTSEISGNTSLKVKVDTDKTDKQPGYFQNQYDTDTRTDKKWSTGAVKYVSLKTDENCVKMLKGFITAVENSNINFKYDWNKDIDQLKNKKVGLVFGLEEYQNDKGETKTATKLNQFRSLDKTDGAKIPKVRLLDGSTIDYEEYRNQNTKKSNNNPFESFDDMIEIDDNMLD